MKQTCNPFSCIVAAALVTSAMPINAQTWDGAGSPNLGGDWSTATNWTGDMVPTTDNTANLDDAGANRTIIYDAAASGALGTLNINQTSAFSNILEIQRSALNVTHPITLDAAAGIERVTFNTVSNASMLTAPGGIILNVGGELSLSAYRVPSSGFINLGNVTANLVISDGTLQIRATDNNVAGNTANSALNTVSGSLTMSSGSIVIDNSTGIPDRRLTVTGNVNITGGTMSSSLVGANGTFSFEGAAAILNPVSYDTDVSITLGRFSPQAFETNVSGPSTFLRGTGVKTFTSTASDGLIGSMMLLDGHNTANSRTTVKLGSNLKLKAGASQPYAATFSQAHQSGRIDFGVDTNGFTLDLSLGGAWTPNFGTSTGVTSTVWDLSGTGVIKAASFNLSTAAVTTQIGAGTTLTAVGGNNSATILSGLGTIDPTSNFIYAGTAAAGTPATLVSDRTLGNLTINNGALRIKNDAVTATGLLTIGSAGTLDLSQFGLTSTGLICNNGTVNTSENLTVTGSDANVLKTGASILKLENISNSYTGTTTLQDGRLNFAGDLPLSTDSSLGNSASDIIVGNASSTTGQRILFFGTSDGTVTRNIDATSASSAATDPSSANRYRIGADIAGGGTLTFDGTLSWGASGAFALGRSLELVAVQKESTAVFNGVISSVAGASGFIINGGSSGMGAVKLANTGNIFTKDITVAMGTLLVGGNAPAGGISVLGTSAGTIGLADGGTPSSNWTISTGNPGSGDSANPAILTDGPFTIARAISLNNSATYSGGFAPATVGNGSPSSYIIGGHSASHSTFTGAVTVPSNSVDKLLRLSQVAEGTVTLNGAIGPNLHAVAVLNVEKIEAGTVILAGNNTYDGNTIVTEGTLQLVDDAQLKFTLGNASGLNNSISGDGTMVINGDFVIDTTAATSLTNGSWILENVSSLTGAYGNSFTVSGYTDIGDNKWSKNDGNGKTWTFDETTGTLTLTSSGVSAFDTWISTHYPSIPLEDRGPEADPDSDGSSNLLEFALNGNPTDGSNNGLIASLIQDSSAPAGNEITLVIAVRDGATFTAGTATVSGITYTVEGSLTLDFPNSPVSSMGPSDTAPASTGLPSLAGTDWEYHTFKLVASEGLAGKGFLRLKVTQP